MRLSEGGCYEITGTTLRRVTDRPSGPEDAARWRERRADLWAESSAIAHVQHTMTVEENGLWNAMQKELEGIDVTLAGIDRHAAAR